MLSATKAVAPQNGLHWKHKEMLQKNKIKLFLIQKKKKKFKKKS